MTDYVALPILGAIVSLLVQFIKSNGWRLRIPYIPELWAVGLSVVAGAVYFFVQDTPFMTAALAVFVTANSVYLYLIKPFQS